MAQGGRIDYTVGFNVDKSGLSDLKQTLQSLGNLTPTQLFNMNPGLFKDIRSDAQKNLLSIKSTLKEVETAFDNAFNVNTGLMNLQKLNTSLKQIGVDNIYNKFSMLGQKGQEAFYKITKSALTTEMQFKKTNGLLDKMGQTLLNTVKWQISSSLINRFAGSISQAYGYVKHLDTSLNDIRIVTGKSADEMERFAEQANKTAQALGKTTTDATEAALIYYQQGLSDEEAQARMETTLKAANVTGQSTAAVSEELTAVWNGYKVATEETEAAVDKLAAVAATTASNLQELSTGMSKVASAANAMGVDMDQLNAQIATIISVTRQAPESVGTALKTIYARLADLKLGDTDEDGLGLGDVSGTLDKVGIAVLDANGDLREMGDVIEDVAAKWNTWTSAQQTAIAEVMAGKRQYNNLVALFENWDMYSSALDTSRNSLGTLQTQQDTYMESTEAHINQLKAEWEDLYDSLLDSKTINKAIDSITKLVSLFSNFTDAIGGGNNLFLMLGSTAMRVFDKQLGQGITNFITNLNKAKENTKELKAQLDTIKAFEKSEGYQNIPMVRALVDAQKQVSQYYDILSNEQINTANALASQVGDVKLLEEQWNHDVDALEEYIHLQKEVNIGNGKKVNVDKYSFRNDQPHANQNFAIVKTFERSGSIINNFTEQIKEANKAYVELNRNIVDQKDTDKQLNRLANAGQTLEAQFALLNEQGLLKNVNPDKLIDIQKNLHKLSSEVSDTEMIKIFDALKADLNSLPKEAQQALNKLKGVFEGGNIDWSAPVRNLSEFLKTAELQQFTTNIVNSIGALGQTFSSFNSLTNIGNILTNEDLTLWEKFSQTIMNIGMSLPMFISSISKLGESFNNMGSLLLVMKSHLIGIASAQNQVNIAQRMFRELNAEQKAELVANIGLTKAEEAAITEENAQIAISSMLKMGNAKATGVLATEELHLAGSTGILTGALEALKTALFNIPLAGWALAGIAATIAITSVALKAHQKYLEQNAEIAKKYNEVQKEETQTVIEQKNKIDELSSSYNHLISQKDEDIDFTKEQREEVLKLVEAYGDQSLVIKALAGDYKGLQESIKAAQDEANNKAIESTQELIETDKSVLETSIIANASGAQRDLNGFDLSGLGGMNKHSDFRNDLADLIGSDTDVIDSSGHIGYEDLIKLLKTDDRQLAEFLDKYKGLKAASQISELVNENREAINSLKEDEVNLKQYELQSIGYSNEDLINDINNVKDYHDVVNSLAQQALDEGKVQSYEEGREWAINFINGYKEGLQEETASEEVIEKIIGNLLPSPEEVINNNDPFSFDKIKNNVTDYYKKAEEIKNNVYETLGDKSSEVLNFVLDNIDLVESYDSLDEFVETYKDQIDLLQKNNSVLTVKTVLENHSGDSFNQEEIDTLYSTEGFNDQISVSKETFEQSSHEQQLAYLADYYNKANQMESEFDQQRRQDAIKKAEEEKERFEEESKIAQQRVDNLKTQLEESSILNEGIEATNEAWTKAKEEGYGGYIDELSNYDAVIEKIQNSNESNSDILENLSYAEQEYIRWLSEEIGLTEEETIAKIKQNNATSKALKNAEKEVKKYNNQVKALAKQIDNLSEGPAQDWSTMLKNTKEMLSLTNKSIDSLQGAYSSLTSIMESYNEEGTLNMDNLQTFLSMDTEYLSALQIENGQMTLNEEALKQIALARLDEAEAEAYQQAIGELHDQQVRDGIAASGEASTANTTLGNAALQAGEAARQGAAGWREYWAAALNREGVANDKVSQQIGQALYNKLQAIDSVRQRIMSGDLGGALGGGSKSSGGSDSGKEADHEEYLEREEDIYRRINEELDQIESTLSRIQKIGDHKWGLDLQKNLEKENELLDKQLDKLQEKAAMQVGDLSSRRKQLENVGVSFSADGSSMNNAESVLNSLYANYNSMVDTYNAMSAAEQEAYKTQLDAEKDRIDKIENKIKDYESTFSDYQSTLDAILENHYAQIEKDVQSFNNMIEVHLELDEAREEWNDFWYDVVKDVEDTDFAGQIEKSMGTLKTLVGLNAQMSESTVAVLTNHLNETIAQVQAQIASANRGGEDSLFGDDTALSKETLENYMKELMDKVGEAKEEIENIGENYLKILDSAQDKIDKQVEGWEAINSHLEHNASLIKLVSGDDAYDSLARVYEQQYTNNLELINTQKQSQDFWAGQINKYKELLSTTEEGSELWKTYSEALETASENYKKAVADLDKTIEQALEDLETWRKNQLSAIEKTLDRALSNNLGLDMLEKEWKLINDNASTYFDNVERALGMEDLGFAFDKILNDTNLSVKAQQELNQMREEEIDRLNQRAKLTQFDVDEVKARLEIKKQELALEDAQRNKSNLRLRRDSQGNYNYQYTADDSQIEDAAEGLMSAKKAWYELVKSRNLDLANSIIENRKNLTQAMQELAEIDQNTDAERYAKQLEIVQMYSDQEKFLMEQGENAKRIFFDGTAEYFADVEDNNILPQWDSTIEQMIDSWSSEGEDSFTGAVEKGINDIEALQEQFAAKTQEILDEAGVKYNDLKDNGIDPTTNSLEGLVDSNEDLADSLEETNDLLAEQADNLKACEDAYNALKDAAVNAIQEAESTLERLAQTAIQTQQQVQASVAAAQSAANISGNGGYSNSSSGSGSGTGSNSGFNQSTSTNTNTGRYVSFTNSSTSPQTEYHLYINGREAGKGIVTSGDQARAIARTARNYTSSGSLKVGNTTYQFDKLSGKRILLNYYDPNSGVTLRSGGYTGTWAGGSQLDDYKSGRLAVLHQKELVLNSKDTANILNTVQAVRDFSVDDVTKSLINVQGTISNLLAGLGSGLMNMASNLTNNTTTDNSVKNTTINADFSGVRSADAIYQALTELENYNMQQIHS